MKRFLIFLYETHYPYGGWNDFLNSFDTLAVAKRVAKDYKNESERKGYIRWHIVDMEQGIIVADDSQ